MSMYSLSTCPSNLHQKLSPRLPNAYQQLQLLGEALVIIIFLIQEYQDYHSKGWDSHSSETVSDPFYYFLQPQVPHVTLLD